MQEEVPHIIYISIIKYIFIFFPKYVFLDERRLVAQGKRSELIGDQPDGDVVARSGLLR